MRWVILILIAGFAWRYYAVKQAAGRDPLTFCDTHFVTVHFSPEEEAVPFGPRYRFLAAANQLYFPEQSYRLKASVLVVSPQPLSPTQDIWASGRLQALPPAFNFYQKQSVRHVFYISHVLRIQEKWRIFAAARWKVRQALESWVHDSMSADTAPLALGMLLGNHRQVSPEVLDEFRVTGVYHVLVASGLKVALAAGLAFLLSWAFPFYARVVFAAAAVLGYAWLAGPEPPVLRALFMALFGFTAILLGRGKDSVSAFLWVGVILLFWNPLWLFDAGFQLSFLSVLGIFLFFEKITKALHFLPKLLAEAVAMTISAQLLILIPLASYFHVISPVSPVANLFLVPLSAVSMALGAVSFAISFISRPAGYAISFGHEKLLWAAIGLTHAFSRIPFAYFWIQTPAVITIVFVYAGFFGLWLWWSKRILGQWIACGSALILLIFWAAGRWVEPAPTIALLKAGRSNYTLLQVNHKTFLIDGGTPAALQERGVNRIDGILLSDSRQAYMPGLFAVMQHFPITQIWAPASSLNLTQPGRESNPSLILQEFLAQAKRKRIPLIEIHNHDKLQLAPNTWLDNDYLVAVCVSRATSCCWSISRTLVNERRGLTR